MNVFVDYLIRYLDSEYFSGIYVLLSLAHILLFFVYFLILSQPHSRPIEIVKKEHYVFVMFFFSIVN